jgi:CheY-like chemotaxis protein
LVIKGEYLLTKPMQKHIVMIEDDPDVQLTTKLMLEISGYRVSAFDAFTNFEEIAALKADCFLLDENLPGISGHIISIILKSKEPTKHIPVVLISANPKLPSMAELGEVNASISKPFELSHLLHVLASAIN